VAVDTDEDVGNGKRKHKSNGKSLTLDGKAAATENKNDTGGGDWREYIRGYNITADQNDDERQRLQDEYEALSRRTKARMEAFLAGCSLAVPGEVDDVDDNRNKHQRRGNGSKNKPPGTGTVSLQDGLSGFATTNAAANGGQHNHHNNYQHVRRGPSLTEKMSRSMIGDVPNPGAIQHPQIEEKDLVVRLEVYIRTVHRVRNLKEECVVAMEPPKVIKTRARYITNAFVATTSYVRNINPVLTRLLSGLTMELLAVECLAEEITKVINRVVLEYVHGTSFASLAFLSTPEVNADSLLTPLIIKYLKYLQADWERLVKECELERMLARALDPSMRKMFKTIEFQSIGHLLEVCHEHRYALSNIELPPNVCAIAENIYSLCNSPDAIRQALRDLRREIITVNGHVLPPVTSRKELIHLLTQTLNSRTLTAKESASSSVGLPSRKIHSHRRRRKATDQKHSNEGDVAPSSGTMLSNRRHQKKSPPDSPSTGETTKNDASDTDNASDADVDESLDEVLETDDAIFSSEYESSSAVDDTAEKPSAGNQKKSSGASRRRRSKFHLSTIDVLTRRLLIAASRTGNGGDAYFFVYVPALLINLTLISYAAPYDDLTVLLLSLFSKNNSKDLFGGEEVDVVPSSTFRYQDRIVRPGTIDIVVRLASVTIKCHQSFDIYPKNLVGECEPLIQFHTTTTESISLQEMRASDSGLEEDAPLGGYTLDSRSTDDEKENPTASTSVMVVKEQETDRTGWRNISIRAAMYERIETWNTPS
jgi:hypothetical protein